MSAWHVKDEKPYRFFLTNLEKIKVDNFISLI